MNNNSRNEGKMPCVRERGIPAHSLTHLKERRSRNKDCKSLSKKISLLNFFAKAHPILFKATNYYFSAIRLPHPLKG